MAEAEGGGAEEGVGESPSPPRAPAPAPAASGGSGGGGRGGGGGGGRGAGGRDICREVFERLVADGHVEAAGASGPELRARLEAHFARLPTSYQLDVNVDKAEDVLIHQKVLAEATDSDRRPAFAIRFLRLEEVNVDETTNSDAHEEGADIGEALSTRSKAYTCIHEILFSTADKPKLLSQLSALLSDIGLNIREAHVFSTTDGYSLDVFVVDAWPIEDTDGLHKALEASILRNEGSWSGSDSSRPGKSLPFLAQDFESDIDTRLLKIVKKVASGSCGDTFLGTYGGEEVAVKILNPENLNENAWDEFKQEIYMLREVDHPNIVRFIGSCTKPPQFYTSTGHLETGKNESEECLKDCVDRVGTIKPEINTQEAESKIFLLQHVKRSDELSSSDSDDSDLDSESDANFDISVSYQLDVNVDKAEDVLIHQKVLAEAKDPDRRPAFTIRFLRLEEVNVDETTKSDAHEEGADIGEALSTSNEVCLSSSDGSDLDLDSDTSSEFASSSCYQPPPVSTSQRRLQFAALLTKRRQPKSSSPPYIPPEDYVLPPLPSLDLPHFQLKPETSSSSSRSSKDESKMDDYDQIFTFGGGSRLATDEEEETWMMEASARVGADLEATEIILRHDAAEASRLEMPFNGTRGTSREILLSQPIVFFGKEQHITSCRVCISDFHTTDRCIRLPCSHIFHMQCVIMWLLEKDTCPVCRRIVSQSSSAGDFAETVDASSSSLATS